MIEKVPLHLTEPPEVIEPGIGLHGVQSLRDVFRLRHLWQFHLYGYSGELTVNGRTYPIRPGSVSLVPPNVEVRFDYRGRSEHLYVHFRATPVGEPVLVPIIQSSGMAGAELSELLRAALEAAPRRTRRVEAEVWTALWRVAQLPELDPRGTKTAVATVMAHVEANLARHLTVPELARLAGLSHNHLTRLFRAETGETVVAYIRRRRMARAAHLLTSTTMSIPAIASSVGFKNLQAFNKACRRQYDTSPRALRARAATEEPSDTGPHLLHTGRVGRAAGTQIGDSDAVRAEKAAESPGVSGRRGSW